MERIRLQHQLQWGHVPHPRVLSDQHGSGGRRSDPSLRPARLGQVAQWRPPWRYLQTSAYTHICYTLTHKHSVLPSCLSSHLLLCSHLLGASSLPVLSDHTAQFTAPGPRTTPERTEALSSPSTSCFASPGPASDTLYCTQTGEGTWITWRWYRYVDQPALQNLGLNAAQSGFMQVCICSQGVRK